MNHTSFKNRGFSLIELLIALALLSIVITLGFSLYSYNNNSFNIANRSSELQWQARMAKTKVESEISCASQITVIDYSDLSATLEEGQQAIYVQGGSKGIIMIKTSSGSSDELLNNITDNVQTSLTFSKIADNRLQIKIDCQTTDSDDNIYSLTTTLFIPKDAEGSSVISAPSGNIGNVIIYKK